MEKIEIDISIVMPCLNEEQTLGGSIEWAMAAIAELKEKHGLIGEVVISDNGSTDKSIEISERMGARVVNCPEKGYGNALIYGITNARGRYIVMGDSDMSYDFRESVPLVEKLMDGYDLCMGTRLNGVIMPKAMPWKNRYIGNPILSGILNLLFDSKLSDAHCGMRAFTKDAFVKMKLVSTGMEFASEMVVKASLLNLKRTEIPITLHKDGRDRPPHLRPWRDGWRHLRFMLWYSPSWLFKVPGIVLLVSSLLAMCFLLLSPVKIMGRTFDVHSLLVVSSLMLISVQLLFFAKASSLKAYSLDILPSTIKLESTRSFDLERYLVIGVILKAIGFSILAYLVYIWGSDFRFGPIDDLNLGTTLRLGIVGTTLFTLGVQIIFSSFYVSQLDAFIRIFKTKNEKY